MEEERQKGKGSRGSRLEIGGAPRRHRGRRDVGARTPGGWALRAGWTGHEAGGLRPLCVPRQASGAVQPLYAHLDAS